MAEGNRALDGGQTRDILRAPDSANERVWAAIVFAAATAIAVVDAAVGERAVLIPLLMLPMATAAAKASLRATLTLGIYCVAAAVVLGVPNEIFGESDHLIRVAAVLGVSALCVYIATVRAHAEEVRRRAEASLRRSSFLAAAGVLLDISLNPEVTLASIARLGALEIAEWASVDVVELDGTVRQVAVAHSDPAKVRLAQELRERYPPDPNASSGVYNVLRTGESEFYGEIDDELLRQVAVDDEHYELIRSLGMTSAVIVPMVARRRTLGALTLVTGGDRQRFDSEDLSMLEELASRCALAIDNARLYEERSYIARTLQQSLLPPALPEIPRLEAAARFRAAGEGIEVGGDFYDLFDAGGGTWAAVMGDVCGKGADAAALTALARYTIRTAAMQLDSPSEILDTLNDAILRQRSDKRFCTVAFVLFRERPGGMVATLASGGHPLPLVLRADGGVEPAGKNGTLLGVVSDPELTDTEVELAPGDTILLYTDGVIEARSDSEMFGPTRLANLLGSCAGRDPDTVAEEIEKTVVDLQAGDPKDDIAILALRVRPAAVSVAAA